MLYLHQFAIIVTQSFFFNKNSNCALLLLFNCLQKVLHRRTTGHEIFFYIFLLFLKYSSPWYDLLSQGNIFFCNFFSFFDLLLVTLWYDLLSQENISFSNFLLFLRYESPWYDLLSQGQSRCCPPCRGTPPCAQPRVCQTPARVTRLLKGQCHEIFDFRFFSWISFPQAFEYTIRAVSNFFENSRRYSQLKVDHRCRWNRWQMKKNFN